MAELDGLVADLADRRGGALVIRGRSGMGKSALLAEFARRVGERSGTPEACRVVLTSCYPEIGTGLTYAPAVDLLQQLHDQAEQPGWWSRVFRGAGRGVATSAPEVLSAIVPGLGAAWRVGREVTEAALNSGSVPLDSVMPIQHGAAARIADALLDRARDGLPVLALVDDIQHIDPSSLLVLDRLVRRLDGEPLALVISHAPDQDPKGGAVAAVEALLDTWESQGFVRRRELAGLPPEAVQELVERRHPGAPAEFSAELVQLTGGHSVFVRMCLEEWSPGSGRIVLPRSLNRVVDSRLRLLDERDRRLISTAAAQGSRFLSNVVAEALGEPHDDVVERLRRIADEQQLIVAEAEPPEWARGDQADCYRFEHGALWRVIYDQQTTEQRRSRHARIAQVLSAHSGPDAPLGRRLEIAGHLDRGGLPCLAASADAHYALARSAALDGLSFVEAEQHCEVAIRAARALPEKEPDRDRRLVAAIELLLSLTEVRWRGRHQPAGGPDIDALATEAERAAMRCADARLIARTTLLRGKTLLATQGLEPSLEKLREAVDRAEQAGDPVALFVAKVEYGRQVSKRRLADGLEQLREVERMYASDPALGATDDPVLQHARNLAEMQLAISLFDSGYLGEALGRLSRCVDRIRREPMAVELPIALNYLAQVHMATAAWPQAEAVLREALAVEENRGGDSGWHAYNSVLLARLLAMDPRRREEAVELAEAAWLETQRTWLANLVPIVRNLFAEVLLDAADGDMDTVRRADRLALATRVETESTGMVRSQIAALALRSRTHLLMGEPAAAGELAREALSTLDRVGDMPALRTEEVLHDAAAALRAAGSEGEARELLDRARSEVTRKAELIDDGDLRRRFLEEVPLNRRILGTEGVV
ncbi:AAA family ATPase [Kitasatospora sp. NPDC051170]|uniref:AAA family ATPase n=1 Tax=Kitasatospora sp. NPDC051170 TaxID=3364056 RepID=UPI0037B3C8D5